MKQLNNPPDYIRLYLVDVHQNLPETIRTKIRFVDINADSMTWRQRFLAFREIVVLYWEAFPKARRVPELPLLANLFWIVTQREATATGVRQSEHTPYWGVHRFNPAIIIGNLPTSAAEHCWKLLDSGRVPIGVVIDMARVVKHVATRTARPIADVFEETVAKLAELDPSDVTWRGGVPLNWDQSVEDAICVHFGLPPMAPKGQRKGKRRTVTLGPGAKPVDHKAETIPAPTADPTPHVRPGLNGFERENGTALPPPPKPERTRAVALSKGADAEEIREAVNALVDAHTESLGAGDRARIRVVVLAHLNDVFNVLSALSRKYNKEAQEREEGRAHALARSERAEYEKSVKFFGSEAPGGQLADLAPIKKLFRQRSTDLHPDRNPGREKVVEAAFAEVQTHYATIVDYHAKHRENERIAS